MQQNAIIAEITNPIVMESTKINPIELMNGQVREVIDRIKLTGDQLFEKTHIIDAKIVQIDGQFKQHLLQLNTKISSEIEKSKTRLENSLNEVTQLWKTKLDETAETYALESRQIIADGSRSIGESISNLKDDSEKAHHSYVNRLEAHLAETKEQHKSLIADLKKQLLSDFEIFVKKSRHELDTTKKSVNDIFDQKLETLLKILSDSTKEIDKNKTITERFIEETKISLQAIVGKFQDQHDDQIYQTSVKLRELESNIERFIEETRVSLQSMVGEFQSEHDLKINQSAVKLGELEFKANSLLETTHSEFEKRWLSMVNTHNENLKSFRDSLKEAVVGKIVDLTKKRWDSKIKEIQTTLDSSIKEYQDVLGNIVKCQEAVRIEIVSLKKNNQNYHVQNENSMKRLQKELNGEKNKNRLLILLITLIFSSVFIYSHYFK
jgi:hypothetical protein